MLLLLPWLIKTTFWTKNCPYNFVCYLIRLNFLIFSYYLSWWFYTYTSYNWSLRKHSRFWNLQICLMTLNYNSLQTVPSSCGFTTFFWTYEYFMNELMSYVFPKYTPILVTLSCSTLFISPIIHLIFVLLVPV